MCSVARGHQVVIATVAAVTALAIAPSTAFGAPAAATIDTDELTLTAAADGGWSTAVGMTNLTTGPLGVTAMAKPATCDLKVGDGTTELPPARHGKVTVSIPATCAAGRGISFDLVARADGVTQSLPVTAVPKKTPTVFWSSLLSFLGALLASFVLVLCVFLIWHGTTPVGATEKKLLTPLAGLDAAWSFKDSVVSNLTAASGLVAVVLGSSDFLKAVLGEDAEAAVAVASIAGAVALALVGAAGVLALTLKRPADKGVTILGLCGGMVVGLGAAGGQVWTVTWLVTDLNLTDLAKGMVWAACGLASLLLIGYASVTMLDLLEHGTKREPAKDPLASPASVEVVAAAIIASARGGRPVTYRTVTALLKDLQPTKKDKAAPRGGRRKRVMLAAEPVELTLAGPAALP